MKPKLKAPRSAVHGEFTDRDGLVRACMVTKREGNVLTVQYVFRERPCTGYIGADEFRPAWIDNGITLPNTKRSDGGPTTL